MKLIVFLGAGVSVPSGLPMVGDLTAMLFTAPFHHVAGKGFISGAGISPRSRKKDETSTVRALLRYISKYDQQFSKNAVYHSKPTYEDLFALCEAIAIWHIGLSDNSLSTSFVEAIERVARPILQGRSRKGRIRDLGRLASDARRFIEAVVIAALQPKTPARLGLLSELARSPTIEQVNIVTLNHDTLVEQYLDQEGIEFVDGFGTCDGDVRWYDDRLYDLSTAKVRLFKLHGSVNWREFVGKSRPAIVLGSDLTHIVDSEQKELKLMLRSPRFLTGVNKAVAYQRGIYADAHFRFHALLRECKRVVMSGYGWGDTAISWRFDTWLDQDRKNAIVLLHPRPEEIAEKSVIAGSAYDYWVGHGQLLTVRKWLCETSASDLSGLLV